MKQLDRLTLPDGMIWNFSQLCRPKTGDLICLEMKRDPDIAVNQHLHLSSEDVAHNLLDHHVLTSLALMSAIEGATYPLIFCGWGGTVVFARSRRPICARKLWPNHGMYEAKIYLEVV